MEIPFNRLLTKIKGGQNKILMFQNFHSARDRDCVFINFNDTSTESKMSPLCSDR